MKLNDKELKTITINEEKRTVTVVSNDPLKASGKVVALFMEKCLGFKDAKASSNIDPRIVTMSRCNPDDEFDKYIGVALALAYNLFGSRTKFIKYVDSLKVVKKEKKIKDEKKSN